MDGTYVYWKSNLAVDNWGTSTKWRVLTSFAPFYYSQYFSRFHKKEKLDKYHVLLHLRKLCENFPQLSQNLMIWFFVDLHFLFKLPT